MESAVYTDSESERWRAVGSRDRQADGKFVYAVRSTGIYCRPSCPSRRPGVDKVIFFAGSREAEEEGFRPCKRCSPQSAGPGDARMLAVARVCKQIEMRVHEPDGRGLTLTGLARAVHMSPHQLGRAFRSVLGITPRQYADAQRMRAMKTQLQQGEDVTTALYEAGFGSASRLYERAPKQLGMTPRTYGRGGEGMQIHFTIANSPLGQLLVAATEKGISAVYLGESDKELKAALRKEYPRADIHKDSRGPEGLRIWVAQILSHLKGREPHLDLPTDVRATAFQRRVWEELRKIPYGSTLSYTKVARKIGKPAAVRAVARACATNPTCIVVPCHRVVREGGNLAGYRWGLDRKRALLEKEAESAKKYLPGGSLSPGA